MSRKRSKPVRTWRKKTGDQSAGEAGGRFYFGPPSSGAGSTALIEETEKPQEIRLSEDIEVNRSKLKELVGHSDDLVRRDLVIGGARGAKCSVYYYQAMGNAEFIHATIIQALVVWARPAFYEGSPKLTIDELRERLVVATEVKTATSIGDVLDGLFEGQTVVTVDRIAEALILRAQGYMVRNPEEPSNETVVLGSREGFIEDIAVNTSMIRRRLKSPHLVVRSMLIGDESRTRIRLVYLAHIAPPALVNEVRYRLERVKVDHIADAGVLEQLITDCPYSIWPTMERTERPERVASQLLQGRVAVMIDNTPDVLVMPESVAAFVKAADDYAQSFYYASIIRLVRIAAFALSTFLTPMYVALVTFHPELIPLPLLLNIASTQEGVPLPLAVIAFGIELTIEVVREAGLRLPKAIGSAVSVVGTIVIGQAAITAGFAPPGLVVVVSIAAIASFAIPDYSAALSFRILRFPALLLGTVLGLYGVTTLAVLALFDLASMKTYGIPLLSLFTPGRMSALLDSILMTPARTTSVGVARRMSYRDRYSAGSPPPVRARIPAFEKPTLKERKTKK